MAYQMDAQSDVFSLGAASTILDEKRARQMASDDATRLYNRVRQLQKEDEKARKRIEETKKKALEILRLRERNDQKMLEKEMRIKELQEQIELQRLQNLRLKDDRTKAKRTMEEKVYQDKLLSAQETKETKQQIERHLQQARAEAQRKALEQKEAIKKSQRDAENRLNQLKQSKMQHAHGDYERRLKDEMEAKLQKEREIERLAELELELIERLKEKQQLQEEAYEQLESVLSLGSVKGSRKSTPTSSSQHMHALSASQAALQAAQQLQQQAEQEQADAGAGIPGEPTDEDLAAAFHIYDTDETGIISTGAVQSLLNDLGMPLNDAQLMFAIQQLDPNGTGTVSFGEFFLWWKG